MLWWGALVDSCVWGCLGAGGSGDGVFTRQASRATAPQRRQRGLRSAQFPTARGRARLVAALRGAPRTSDSDGGRFFMGGGQPAAAGNSAVVEAVVGKRLPLSLVSIPSLHTKGVRQRFINAAAPNSAT